MSRRGRGMTSRAEWWPCYMTAWWKRERGTRRGGVLLTASWPSRVRDCTRKQKAGRPLLHDIIQSLYQARPRPPVHETVFPPDLHFPLLLTCYLLSIRPRVTETLSYLKLAYGLPTSFSTLWHVPYSYDLWGDCSNSDSGESIANKI